MTGPYKAGCEVDLIRDWRTDGTLCCQVRDGEGETARALALRPKPLGLGVIPDLAARVERIEHIASSFSDPGGDWNEFHLYDAAGAKLGTLSVDGY